MLSANEINFKNNITSISLEINSDCNRKCVYCPHSLMSRKPEKMDESLLIKIIQELKTINYNGELCLNIYNEPLINFSFLLSTMDLIKLHLPDSSIFFSTNGDFLTKDRLDILISHGLSRLIITCHQNNFNFERGKALIENMMRKLDIKNYLLKGKNNYLVSKVEYQMDGKENTPLRVFSSNFLITGQNRANTLKDTVIAPKNFKRFKECNRPRTQLSISYDGTIYPCCMFFHGLNDQFIIGNCTTQSIFDLYSHPKYAHFKEMCSLSIPYESPCLECTERHANN